MNRSSFRLHMRPTIIGALFTLLFPIIVRAQEIPARLTLDDALRIARAHNPHFRQVISERELAELRRRVGLRTLLPTITANFGTGGGATRTLSGQGNLGEVIESETYVRSRSSSSTQGISASLTLFDGGASLSRIRATSLDSRSVEARIVARAMQLRADISIHYYAALQATHTLRVEEELLASAREHLAMTRRRFEIGAARREELLGAEAQVAAQEQHLERARSNLRQARLYLLRELGVVDFVDFEPIDEIGAVFDPAGIDEEALIAAALESSPRIIEREATVASRRYGVSIVRGARFPKITASGNLSRSTQGREFGALFDLSPRNRSLAFSISISLPLFSGFQTSYEIANAELDLRNASEQLLAERIALATEIRAALIDLGDAYRSYRHAERSLALGKERLELTEERYRSGGNISFIDLQSAIDGVARAERQRIDARFAFFNALIALEAKVGQEIRP